MRIFNWITKSEISAELKRWYDKGRAYEEKVLEKKHREEIKTLHKDYKEEMYMMNLEHRAELSVLKDILKEVESQKEHLKKRHEDVREKEKIVIEIFHKLNLNCEKILGNVGMFSGTLRGFQDELDRIG